MASRLRPGLRIVRRWCSNAAAPDATTPSGYVPDRAPHVEMPRNPAQFEQFQHEVKKVPTAADRGAGLHVAARDTSNVDADLAAQPQYQTGVDALKWGDWSVALEAFEALRGSGDRYKNHPAVLMLVARCLIQMEKYEEALKTTKVCGTLHAGYQGLADMTEEAQYGVDLSAEERKDAQEAEDKLQESRDKHGRFTKDDIPTQEGIDLLNALPLEPEVRDYLKRHIGEDALSRFGIVHEDVRGRALVAKQLLPKGSVIYRDTTLAFAPEYMSMFSDPKLDPKQGMIETPDELKTAAPRPTYCSHCHGTIPSVRSTCGDCGLVYCSTACQNDAAETYHKYECAALSSDAVKATRDRLRQTGHEDMLKRWLTIIRCAALSLHYDLATPANEQPWVSYLSYVEGEHKKNHVSKATDGKHKDEYDSKITIYGLMILVVATRMMPVKHANQWENFPELRRREILKEFEIEYDALFDKVKLNVTKPGYQLFPVLSLVNHSCIPNATMDDSGVLRATEDIPPGEEITVSYTPRNVPVEKKHFWLRKNKKFTCVCPYCAFKMQDEKMARHLERESMGHKFMMENQGHRVEYEDPERLTTSTGRVTRAGLEKQAQKHERMLAKYPKEFREALMQWHEKVEKELETKTMAEVKEDLRQRKERLERFQKLGLVPVEQKEIAAIDSALESMRFED